MSKRAVRAASWQSPVPTLAALGLMATGTEGCRESAAAVRTAPTNATPAPPDEGVVAGQRRVEQAPYPREAPPPSLVPEPMMVAGGIGMASPYPAYGGRRRRVVIGSAP